ncbi:MAG: 8-oxo-dGTP diphosphatase [Candidatus Sericytochromatia bacterium]|nr:8-oxo-dGTP diphosphatase [Candidatus Sericytochromatia bacterium]
MPYTPILGTLAYVRDASRSQVLLVHRNARQDDAHLGKWNGLGGKMEPDESPVSCIRRELMEEAGIVVEAMALRGTINWPGFGPNGENWFGFIFLVDAFEGTPWTRNEEGSLCWHPISALLSGELPLWEGDRHFLPLVFDEDPRPFHGVMPYAHGRPTDWQFARL